MTTDKISDTIFVYDRYYSSKPNVFLQSLKRILLCCGMTVFPILFLLEGYGFPVSAGYAALVSSLFSVGFSVLFIFVKKRFAVPAIVAAGGLLIYFNRVAFWKKFSFFVDAALLSMDGRLLDMEDFTWHSGELLTSDNRYYVEGVLLGFTLICGIIALINAASMFRKPHILLSILTFILSWVPRLIAEQLEFNFWLVPAIAFYAGAGALSVAYRQGIAIRRGSVHRTASEDRNFARKASEASFFKRAGMNEIHYSKYFSSAVSAGAMFMAAVLISELFIGNGTGIDFSEMFSSLGNMGGGISSPFESGAVSDYFSNSQGSGLGLTSPGQGEQEILRVTNTGDMPVYLRGDIGIDFKGTSWTSPVTAAESDDRIKVPEEYRPVEMKVAKSLVLADNNFDNADSIISEADVTVNYLCPTDVVFLPSYTGDTGFYESEMFDVYGDFSVRVNDSYDKINTVRCKAFIPKYTYTGAEDAERGTAALGSLVSIPFADSFETLYDSFIGYDGVMTDYSCYVYSNYLGVPENMQSELDGFMEENRLTENYEYGASWSSEAEKNYSLAMKISDFLQENYAYSLETNNGYTNPVMKFLTGTKKGHCALYASAMTLMVRRLGIPARYCTGFVAKPGASGEILRAKHLHAWCEVYIGEIGWVTFDPTSSSLSRGVTGSAATTDEESEEISASDSESGTEEISVSEPESETGAAMSTSSSYFPEESSDESVAEAENSVNILPYLLIMFGIIAVLLAVVLLVMWYSQLDKKAKKRIKRMRSGDALYAKLLEVLSLFGLKPGNGELPLKFFRRADLLLKTNLSDHPGILEKAAFGKLSREEVAVLARLLEQVFDIADKQAKGLRKIRLRLIFLRLK